jgi:hypothetical protein
MQTFYRQQNIRDTVYSKGMKRLIRFWKIIVLDVLGVALMVLAILTGWLPGPGGIPLFIIGLSLLAVNHEWAERYIELLKKYADRFGDMIFIERPRVKLAYDVLAILASLAGVLLLLKRTALWMLPLGTFLFFIGIVVFLRNRHRYRELKKRLLRK